MISHLLPQLRCEILRSGRNSKGPAKHSPYTVTLKLSMPGVDRQVFRAFTFDRTTVWVNDHYSIQRVNPNVALPDAPTTPCSFQSWIWTPAHATIETIITVTIPDEYLGHEAFLAQSSKLQKLGLAKIFSLRKLDSTSTSTVTPFRFNPSVQVSVSVEIGHFSRIEISPFTDLVRRRWQATLNFEEQYDGTFLVPAGFVTNEEPQPVSPFPTT
ncbi:hypothetical protein DL93DRAFT_2164355 [Clavulina sp. PMI_390]|nr:hypothetical protein DL93DRAFT_2164355 [Clavulina sp. PMI_390]